MRRLAFVTGLAVALVTASAGPGLAQSKRSEPTIAVLGLEIVADGDIDDDSASFAAELTNELRGRAKVRKGPYRLAPNSNKDLLEMKLLSNCADEGRDCMRARSPNWATALSTQQSSVCSGTEDCTNKIDRSGSMPHASRSTAMTSFREIGATGQAGIDTVAPGIAEALIATAIGLVAAIPAVIAFNYFQRRVRIQLAEMETFESDFLNIVRRHFLK